MATDTLASVKGNEKLLDTRVPPSDMHKDSFDEVLGKKPVALLFSTPQLCQSRVCGPVTDVALQLKAKYGDQIEFIHQEVYADNDPNEGLRPPLQAFHLPTEPWLFVVNAERQGHRAPGGLVRPDGVRERAEDRPVAMRSHRVAAVVASPRWRRRPRLAHSGLSQRQNLPLPDWLFALGGGRRARGLVRRAGGAVAAAAAGGRRRGGRCRSGSGARSAAASSRSSAARSASRCSR